MKFQMPANWQPKLISLIIAFAAWVEFDPQLFPHWLQSLSHFLTIAGFALFGWTTKQWNTTGGTVPNKRNNADVVAATAGIAAPVAQVATMPPPAPTK